MANEEKKELQMDPLKILHALRNRLRARSGNTLARPITYKGMLELVDEALAELGNEPTDDEEQTA